MPDHITTKRQPASDICRIIRQKHTRPCTRRSFDFDYTVFSEAFNEGTHATYSGRILFLRLRGRPEPVRDSRPFPLLVCDTPKTGPTVHSIFVPACACSTSTRSVNSSQAMKSSLLRTRTAAPFGNYHNSYYCFCLVNLFLFRRLYPARLSMRRRVPQKDRSLMARTFGTDVRLFFLIAHRGLRFAFHD